MTQGEVLYNIITGFSTPMKPVGLIKTRLNETYSKVRIGKHLSDTFLIRLLRTKEMLYRHCFSTLL
jgi:hypothetical protein